MRPTVVTIGWMVVTVPIAFLKGLAGAVGDRESCTFLEGLYKLILGGLELSRQFHIGFGEPGNRGAVRGSCGGQVGDGCNGFVFEHLVALHDTVHGAEACASVFC